jgi:hypothetical protein
MLTHVQTPSGDLIARHLIDRVTLIPKKGVLVMDGYGRMLAYVKLEDAAQAERVRDLFRDVVLEKRNAKQPDWSFLTPPAPVVATATKAPKLPKAPSDDTDTDTEV